MRLILLDVVGYCPPGFTTSHSGCHFDPGAGELIACACCSGILGIAIVGILVLVLRKKRESGPREG